MIPAEALTLPGVPAVTVALRRSARARRMSLRVSGIDGRVTLSLPRSVARSEAMAFLRAREDWLRRHLAAVPEPTVVAPGVALPVQGLVHRVTAAPVRHVTAEGGQLLVPGDAPTGPRVAAWLRGRARECLSAAIAAHAEVLGRAPGRITLRDTRSRWGSCTAAGNLNFSWRLVMAPPEILDYVAAHEVAHLVQMNHSRAFWAEVARLCPDHRARARWLRANGAALHRWRFEAC